MIIDFNYKSGGGSGSTVVWTQELTAGTEIAKININGTQQNVYAPNGGGTSYEAGANIQISGNTISATDTTYSAGSGISINNGVINCTVSGGTTYTAGDNIQINDNVISATDTTYTAGSGISIDNGVINCTVSGGGGSEVSYYNLSNMSQAERATAYNAISGSNSTTVFAIYHDTNNNFGWLSMRYMGMKGENCRFMDTAMGANAGNNESQLYIQYLELDSSGNLTTNLDNVAKYVPYVGYMNIDNSGNPTGGDTNSFRRGLMNAPGSWYVLETLPIRYDTDGSEHYARGGIEWAIDNGDETSTFSGKIKIGSTIYQGVWNVSDSAFTKVSFTASPPQ